jgi:hypothetical protein
MTRTRNERNAIKSHQTALKSKGFSDDYLIREQGVGSSNLPAPTNKINNLEIFWNISGRIGGRFESDFMFRLPAYIAGAERFHAAAHKHPLGSRCFR